MSLASLWLLSLGAGALQAQGSPSTWIEQGYAPDLPLATNHPRSLASDASHALVGSGNAADLYAKPPTGTPLPPHIWLHAQHFTPQPGSTGLFGTAVAISGNLLAIGAPYGDPALINNGYVDIYEHTGSSWTFVQKLLPTGFVPPPPFFPEVMFGGSLALSGNTLVVGAQHYHDTAGLAFVFERVGGTFQQTQLLQPAVTTKETSFGECLALVGDRLAISRRGPGGAAGTTGMPDPLVPGEVYVYVRQSGSFVLEQILVSPASVPSDRFGAGVAMDETRLITRDVDTLYGFVRTGSSWSFDWELPAPPLPLGPSAIVLRSYGNPLIADDLFVGDPLGDMRSLNDVGRVVRYVQDATGAFTPHQTLFDPSLAAGEGFGRHISISGNLLVIGHREGSPGAQRVRVYKRQTHWMAVP